jgi:hypothetical protein
VLLLGCGVFAWGVATGISSFGMWRGGNLTVTIHNLGALLSGVCSLAGAVLAGRARWRVRPPGPWVAAFYSTALVAVVVVTVASLESWMPVFFVQGVGGTPVRQAVLGLAIGTFGVTSVPMWRAERRTPSAFLHWYAPGLALLAAGLAGVWLQTAHGDLLGWTSRTRESPSPSATMGRASTRGR